MSYIGKKIKDVMIPKEKIVYTTPDETVKDAVKQMVKKNVGSILVVENDKVVGIFTERDLMRLVAEDKPVYTPIGDVMTKHPVTLKPDDPLSKAALVMGERGFRHIPIVDEEGRLVGIISSRDVSRVFYEATEAAFSE